MSVQFVADIDGVLTVKLSGKVQQSELASAQKNAAAMLQKQGGSRLLVLAEKFDGFEKGGHWGDLSAQSELDAQIDRMAIVGEKRWEAIALLFVGKGVRRVAIEYFLPADEAKARAWLTSANRSGD